MKKVVVFLCLSLVIGLFFWQSVQAQSGNSNPVSVVKPEFPGGMDSLYNFIYKRLDKYTFSKAESEATHDRVLFLLFEVKKDGSVVPAKNVDEDLNRIVRQMPKWKPGTIEGVAVDMDYSLPLGFRFRNKDYQWGDAIPQSLWASTDYIYKTSEVDEAPEFPGGLSTLLVYIQRIMEHPPVNVVGYELLGKAIVRMVVRKDGSLDNIEIVRSVDSVWDNKILRFVKDMPRWKPGMKDGKVVNTEYLVPISLKLP